MQRNVSGIVVYCIAEKQNRNDRAEKEKLKGVVSSINRAGGSRVKGNQLQGVREVREVWCGCTRSEESLWLHSAGWGHYPNLYGNAKKAKYLPFVSINFQS